MNARSRARRGDRFQQRTNCLSGRILYPTMVRGHWAHALHLCVEDRQAAPHPYAELLRLIGKREIARRRRCMPLPRPRSARQCFTNGAAVSFRSANGKQGFGARGYPCPRASADTRQSR